MLLLAGGGPLVTQVFKAETVAFQNRPRLHRRVGFAMVIILAIVLCAGMYGAIIWGCVALVRAAGF